MDRPIFNPADKAELDLMSLWGAFWKQKRLFLIIQIIIFALGIIYLHLATPKYTVALQVISAKKSGGVGLTGGAAALAGMAGINVGEGSDDRSFILYLNGYKSREVASALAQRDDLTRNIFPDEWDAGTGTWKEPYSALKPLKNIIKNVLGIPVMAWQPPSGARLQEFLNRSVTVAKSTKDPVVTITFETANPKFGQDLLWALHSTSDNYIKGRTVKRTDSYIKYLLAKLETVRVDDYRKSLIDALSEQEKAKMAASSDLPFSAEPFAPPEASFMPTSPVPLAVLLYCIFMGLIIGVPIAVIREKGPEILRQLKG